MSLNIKFLSLQKKSFTLIELILSIVILGVAVSGLLKLLSEVTQSIALSENTATATFYAQEMMEKIKSKSFSEVDGLSGTDSPAPGHQRTVSIEFAELNGSIWEPAACPPNCDYKKITVSITKSPSFTLDLVTLISDY